MVSTVTSIQPLESQSTPRSRDLLGEKYEWAWLTFILFIFLLVNVFSADRYPFPFCDEVILTDPAVNYVMGHGFTTAVRVANSPAFYFGNVPAHPGLLIPWLKVFGVSMRSVRSINFVEAMDGVADLVCDKTDLASVTSCRVAIASCFDVDVRLLCYFVLP